MADRSPVYIIGDIHGHVDKLVHHLRITGLVNSSRDWTGEDAQLWLMGDLTDRGPDGVGVIDLVMRLQHQAAARGGRVDALLGNHDAALLAALLFADAPTRGPGGTFFRDWVENGGILSDVQRLEARHVDWLVHLAAMQLVQDRLLLHADATFYLAYGQTVQGINAGITRVLEGRDVEEWDRLLGYAGERLVFSDQTAGGVERARAMLGQIGGRQIVHGHTPIPALSGQPIEQVTRAFVYADGLVVDVDGGIYKGGPGFVYEAIPVTADEAIVEPSRQYVNY
jgi:hypothetical protein